MLDSSNSHTANPDRRNDLFLDFVACDATPLLLANGAVFRWREGGGWKPLDDAASFAQDTDGNAAEQS